VVALVLLACCAGLLAWSDARPPEEALAAQSARALAIDRVSLACPGLRGSTGSSLAVGTLPGGAAGGEVSVAGVEAPAEPGAWSVRSDADGTVSARGPAAAATQAWRAGVADAGSGHGLTVGACPRPGTDVSFVGAGSTVEHESTLVVSNPGRTPAAFDVTLLTANGEMVPVSTQGIALRPREQQEIPLSSVAADRGDVAVLVRASEGRVAAWMLDGWTAGLQPAGTEWVPAAAPAAESLTLTGVPAETVDREVVLANPGERTIVVRLQVVGPDATFVPGSLTGIEVPARSSTSVPLPRSLDDDALGLRLDADEPVLAAVRARSSGPRTDVAYAVSAPALTGPVVVPIRLGAVTASVPVLSLAAGRGSGAVSIAAFDGAGAELATSTVELPAGLTTTYDPGRRLARAAVRNAAYLVLAPRGAAPVQAAATYTSSRGGVSVLPLSTPPTTVLAPAAVPAGG
jgi:P pilus assembly chaperone PapD